MAPISTLAAALAASFFAQAEPAPPEPAPVVPVVEEKPLRPNGLGVAARFAYRRAPEGEALSPAAGFSLGATYQRRYLTLRDRVGLGVAVDLFYDHFAADVQTAEPINGVVASPPDAQRVISQTSFAALQTVALDAGPAVVWVGGGVGVTIASLSTPEVALAPGSLSALQPLARAAVGVELTVAARTALVVRADLTHPFTHPTLTTTKGDTVRPFGELLDVGLGLLYRF
jgi:hypothetical protein